MISKIDCKRVYTFVAVAYVPSIVVDLVIFLNGGLFSSYPTPTTPLAASPGCKATGS